MKPYLNLINFSTVDMTDDGKIYNNFTNASFLETGIKLTFNKYLTIAPVLGINNAYWLIGALGVFQKPIIIFL